MNDLNELLRALNALRMNALPEEYDIHAAVCEAFDRAGIAYVHEAKLAPRCRIDFLCGRIGLEVKKGKPPLRTLRTQLTRYAQTGALDTIIVLTEQSVRLPATISGIPVRAVSLNRLWGIALP